MVNDENMNEYEKALHFLEMGCGCDFSTKILKKAFAKMCKAFSKS